MQLTTSGDGNGDWDFRTRQAGGLQSAQKIDQDLR